MVALGETQIRGIDNRRSAQWRGRPQPSHTPDLISSFEVRRLRSYSSGSSRFPQLFFPTLWKNSGTQAANLNWSRALYFQRVPGTLDGITPRVGEIGVCSLTATVAFSAYGAPAMPWLPMTGITGRGEWLHGEKIRFPCRASVATWRTGERSCTS